MAAFPLKVRGLNVLLVAFSLLVLGGSAYAMSQTQNIRSGASNVVESATGKLVKKGTPAFSPCKDTTTPYALIGAQPTTPINAKVSPTPAPSCTPLEAQSALADPLVGFRVIATGTFTNGIFYATDLTLAQPSPSQKPRIPSSPRPLLPIRGNPKGY